MVNVEKRRRAEAEAIGVVIAVKHINRPGTVGPLEPNR